jgi:hypothetical protein
MSTNGFQSKIWGPSAWLFLHCITLNYEPTKHSDTEYLNFFKSLQFVLPCGTCRSKYSELIKGPALKLKLSVFKSRESLSFWFFKIHNNINIRTGKTLTYSNDSSGFEKMKIFYEQFRAKCDNNLKFERGCEKPLYKNSKYRSVITIQPAGTRCKTVSVKKQKSRIMSKFKSNESN